MDHIYTIKPIEELLLAAEGGDIEALNSLAMLHELKLIPDASLDEAIAWYKRALAAGDFRAALFLAHIFDKRNDLAAGDPQSAAHYYKIAEQNGFRRAEDRLIEAGVVQRRTVLVVEDSGPLRSVIASLLRGNDFTVIEAEDAAEALYTISTGVRINLVLSDVRMPNMDGIDMLAVIRNQLNRADLPVIMLTSARELDGLRRAKFIGVQGWLLKPFEDDTLLQTVRRWIAA